LRVVDAADYYRLVLEELLVDLVVEAARSSLACVMDEAQVESRRTCLC
jgi:hypothetical protein